MRIQQLKLEDVQPYFSAQTDLVLNHEGGKHIASIYLLPSDPASRRVAMFLLDATQIEQEIEKAFADDLAYFTLYAQDGKQLFHREYGSQATLVCRPDSQNAVGYRWKLALCCRNCGELWRNTGICCIFILRFPFLWASFWRDC